ncbi:MAG: 30S ribosomal protein S16 [Prevotellaceae bacterium]|jgi:small subunit ribosomal protein S16|nr:30S ribosomal protein S16 [Prevotellaceae bacterium]
MATKIRLQRHGKKGYAYYHIVVADSRAPRDGRFIERLGSYNPNTNPATIDLNFERSLYWLQTGAQPTDTTKNILSAEGVYLKKHLLGGVKKGAFDEATAENKFNAWKSEKEKNLSTFVEKTLAEKAAEYKRRLDSEVEKNKAKAAELARKKLDAMKAEEAAIRAEAAAAKAEEVAVAEEPVATQEPEADETTAVVQTEENTEEQI